MRLRNQDFNQATTHKFTLNQSMTHTFTGLGMDQIWGFTFYYESLFIVDGTTDSTKTKQRSDQSGQPPISQWFPVIVSPYFQPRCLLRLTRLTAANDKCLQLPPLPSLPTHRALFSTPVNDKTMQLCYLTAAADGDYSPVEAWCLSRAG